MSRSLEVNEMENYPITLEIERPPFSLKE